jgi:ribosomal RNA-processing protein 9
MPKSFFSIAKRKKPSGSARSNKRLPSFNQNAPSGRRQARDDSISGSDTEAVDFDGIDYRQGRNDAAREDDDLVDENETAAEKRVRLAKGYLAKVREEVEAAREEGGFDAAEIDQELIASRLQKDVVSRSVYQLFSMTEHS